MIGTGFLLLFPGIRVFFALLPVELFTGCYGMPPELHLDPLFGKSLTQQFGAKPLIQIKKKAQFLHLFHVLELFGEEVSVKFVAQGLPQHLKELLGVAGEGKAYVHKQFWFLHIGVETAKVSTELLEIQLRDLGLEFGGFPDFEGGG